MYFKFVNYYYCVNIADNLVVAFPFLYYYTLGDIKNILNKNVYRK